MKYALLIFTFLLLSSNFCNAQSKLTPTVIKDGGGYSEEELKSRGARLAMRDEKLKIESLAYKTASKEKIAREMERLERDTKESIERDAKNTIHLTGESDRLELSNFEYQMAVSEALKNSNFYSYRYSGMNEHQAYQMVQNDRQMDAMGEEISKSVNEIGMLILSGFEQSRLRKESEERERRARITHYKKQFTKMQASLKKANGEFTETFKRNLDKNFPVTNDKTQLKKRVLAAIAGYNDYIYPRSFLGVYNRQRDEIATMIEGKVVSGSRDKTRGFVHQKINKAYFKGNTLFIDITEQMKQTEADQNTLRPKSKRSPYRPIKYSVRSIIAVDIENNVSSIIRKSVWSNEAKLPTTSFLSNDDFNTELKKISDYNYAVPSKLENIGINIEGLNNRFNSLLNDVIKELQIGLVKEKRNTLKSDAEYMKNYMYDLNNDISYFRNYIPYVFSSNNFKSSNKKEESVLFLLSNKKYIIFSFPEKSKIDLLMDDNVWSKKEDFNDLPKVTVLSNGIRESFRQSTEINDSFIGGAAGEDLLLDGERPSNFKNFIHSFFLNGTFLKEAYVGDFFNKDIWNPRVEFGSYYIAYDSDIITDADVLSKLSKIKAVPSSNYNTLGLKLHLGARNKTYLLPVKKNSYEKTGRVDVTYKDLNDSYTLQTSRYKNMKSENFHGIKILKGGGRTSEEISFGELRKYKELRKLMYNSSFSEQIMNHLFKFVDELKKGSVSINTSTKGSIGALNLIVKNLSTIDYSESVILNDGRSKHFSEDGILESVGFKIGDKKYGYWEYFHSNGTLKISCSYVLVSSLDDLYQEFDDQGRLIKKVRYDFGDVEGEFKTYEYLENDYHYEYTHNTEGIKDGLRSLFKSNILVRTKMFENGLPSLETTMYYSTGEILGKFNTINGKINGYLEGYYENGNIRVSGEYIND
ncbi:MAG: antitoxin component YwqK of YwqJK toxin-antitoxin module, partial [Flavobacteriales bacterium]